MIALAPYMGYLSIAYFQRGACCGISFLEGWPKIFLPEHINDGLVLALTVISMFFYVSDYFRLCVVWYRLGKI